MKAEQEYKDIYDKYLNSQPLKRTTRKIKGKQYARPFFIYDRFYSNLINATNQLKKHRYTATSCGELAIIGDLKLTESLQDFQKRIYTALQVPIELMGSAITKLGEAGMAGAKAAESFKIQLKKIES